MTRINIDGSDCQIVGIIGYWDRFFLLSYELSHQSRSFFKIKLKKIPFFVLFYFRINNLSSINDLFHFLFLSSLFPTIITTIIITITIIIISPPLSASYRTSFQLRLLYIIIILIIGSSNNNQSVVLFNVGQLIVYTLFTISL